MGGAVDDSTINIVEVIIIIIISDHFLVMSDVNIGCPKPQLQRFSYRDLRAVDPEVFATHLQMTDVYT